MKRKYAILMLHFDDDGNETDCEVLTRHFFWFMAAFKLWLNRKLNGDPLEHFIIGTRLK